MSGRANLSASDQCTIIAYLPDSSTTNHSFVILSEIEGSLTYSETQGIYRIDARKRPGANDSTRFKLNEADHSLASAKWKARSTLSFGNSSRFRSQDRLSPKYNRFTLSNNQKCFDFAIASTAFVSLVSFCSSHPCDRRNPRFGVIDV